MEVRIGVQSAPRELVVESVMTPEEIQEALVKALGMDRGVFALDDAQGRRVVIPVDKLAYVEIGEQEPRKVGFGTL